MGNFHKAVIKKDFLVTPEALCGAQPFKVDSILFGLPIVTIYWENVTCKKCLALKESKL